MSTGSSPICSTKVAPNATRSANSRLNAHSRYAPSGTSQVATYAVGAATLGSYFPGVDTFLGLQFAALRVADDLARLGFCQRIGTVRSITNWWSWLFNRKL